MAEAAFHQSLRFVQRDDRLHSSECVGFLRDLRVARLAWIIGLRGESDRADDVPLGFSSPHRFQVRHGAARCRLL